MQSDFDPSPYWDRSIQPAQTLRRVAPYLVQFGITRLARQTGLDVIGLPVWAAFRPNSRSIAVNQGKGLTDDLARASATMEALEYAVAENPTTKRIRATECELRSAGFQVFSPHRLLPAGTKIPDDKAFDWLKGRTLFDDTSVLVHKSVCALDGVFDLEGLCQTTNGLASGNTRDEAVFHAICELIERDAVTHWAFLSDKARASRCVRPEVFEDRVVLDLVEKIETSGASLRLFDLTVDTDICVISAVIRQNANGQQLFSFASGSGCHPVPSLAAIRALTEAAQSRLTAIAAARDDINPSDYRQRAPVAASRLFDAVPGDRYPKGARLGTKPAALLAFVTDAIRGAGCSDPVVVDLTQGEFPFAVVKVVSTQFEDWDVNANWRPGPRLLLAAA